MDMKTVMLNPKGRIGPIAFRNAALILIVIGAVLSLLSLLGLAVGMLAGIVSLVLIYPWVAIWVKRLHDAGKSGWWFLAVLVPYLIVSLAVSSFVGVQFGPPAPDLDPNTMDFAATMATVAEQMRATLIPNAIASVVIALVFVLGANAILKSDPGPNAYGPPPAQ